MRKLLLAAALTLLAAAAPAQATRNIWSPYASGTANGIQAVDYVAAGSIWYATSAREIFHNGSLVATLPSGAGTITDLAFNPSGTLGLATSTGVDAATRLWRWNGTTWGAVNLANTTYSHTCDGSPHTLTGPSQPLRAVAWGDDSTAFVIGDEPALLLRGNGTTFTDVNRKADGTCNLPMGVESTNAFTGVAAASATKAMVINANFGHRFLTGGGFTSANTLQANSSTCQDAVSHVAFNPADSTKTWTAGDCEGAFAFEVSADDGVDYANVPVSDNTGRQIHGLTDVSASADGSAIAVGRQGDIIVATSPTEAYFQPYGTSSETWVSVSKLDADHAVIGGFNGTMLISSQAAATPDEVSPIGTISGPANVAVNTPTTYTLNASDVGSGINPASIGWLVDGVPTATGNPATIRFTTTGPHTVSAQFADNEGNTGSASIPVNVGIATGTGAGGPGGTGAGGAGSGTIPHGTKNPTPTKSVAVSGGSITLSGPKTCVAPGKTFTATLAFKAKTRKKGHKTVKIAKVAFSIDGKVVKTDKKAPFVQKLSVKAYKASSKHTLKAKATIKVSKGKKAPTKSVSIAFQVCAS